MLLRFVHIGYQKNRFNSGWLTDKIDKRKFLAALEFASNICRHFIKRTVVYCKLETVWNEFITMCFKRAFENVPKWNKKDHENFGSPYSLYSHLACS